MKTDIEAESSTASRDISLGYLRAFIVLLVVAHHVATAYAPLLPHVLTGFPDDPKFGRAWGAFPVVSAERSPGFLLFIGLNDTFFMSLLFLLSGLYVVRSIERRGLAGFTKARLWRLGVPFVLCAALLAPLAYAPAYMQITGSSDLGAYVRLWFGTPSLSIGPAWFIWLLLAFDLVAAAMFGTRSDWAARLRALLPGGDRPFRFFGALMLLSALVYIPMATAVGSLHWTMFGPLQFQTSRLFHYALYFAVGIGLGTQGARARLLSPDGPLVRRWWMWGVAALLVPVIGGIAVGIATGAKGLTAPVREAIGGIGFVYACAALCFVFLAVFLRFVRGRSVVMDSLRDNSYGIYLVHYVFVNWLNYALLRPALPATAKFAIAFAGAAGLSWITAALLRRLPGLKAV